MPDSQQARAVPGITGGGVMGEKIVPHMKGKYLPHSTFYITRVRGKNFSVDIVAPNHRQNTCVYLILKCLYHSAGEGGELNYDIQFDLVAPINNSLNLILTFYIRQGVGGKLPNPSPPGYAIVNRRFSASRICGELV